MLLKDRNDHSAAVEFWDAVLGTVFCFVSGSCGGPWKSRRGNRAGLGF